MVTSYTTRLLLSHGLKKISLNRQNNFPMASRYTYTIITAWCIGEMQLFANELLPPAIKERRRGAFHKRLRAHNWNLVIYISALMCILVGQRGRKFAHVTTAELLWWVQTCDLIRPLLRWAFLQNLNYELKWVSDRGKDWRLFMFLPWKQYYSYVWFNKRWLISRNKQSGTYVDKQFLDNKLSLQIDVYFQTNFWLAGGCATIQLDTKENISVK